MTVIVTGCGGFLGREIVRQLIARGERVIGISRGRYPDLEALGMIAVRGDLCASAFVNQTIANADAVIHTAAKAGVWGRWDGYYEINTAATSRIIDACRANDIGILVHTSSPSVTFDGNDQRGIDESVPYPDQFLCAYPHTKMLAEQAVLSADGGKLRTVALRPHLIWGVGDPHLIPRIVQRAKLGKLRIVGGGNNRVDTVHVVNAAAAHLDALDTLRTQPDRAGGRAFFITDDAPLDCWGWIAEICRLHHVLPPTRRISFAAAHRVGRVLETVYRITGRTAEPPMTRFVAAQLARDHWFDITAAKERLGYCVRLSPSAGMAAFAANDRER